MKLEKIILGMVVDELMDDENMILLLLTNFRERNKFFYSKEWSNNILTSGVPTVGQRENRTGSLLLTKKCLADKLEHICSDATNKHTRTLHKAQCFIKCLYYQILKK